MINCNDATETISIGSGFIERDRDLYQSTMFELWLNDYPTETYSITSGTITNNAADCGALSYTLSANSSDWNQYISIDSTTGSIIIDTTSGSP